MKVIRIAINAANDGDKVSGSISIHRRRSGAWVVDEVINYISGDPGAERTFLLADDQRLVVEGESSTTVVYDREQSAAVPRLVETQSVAPTPLDTDGKEQGDTPAIAENAIYGQGLSEAMAQERRDALVTAARQKLKEAAVGTPPRVELQKS